MKKHLKCRTFTCNEVLLQCGISIFTKVKDMNTSSTTTKTLATVKKRQKNRGGGRAADRNIDFSNRSLILVEDERTLFMILYFWSLSCCVCVFFLSSVVVSITTVLKRL